jgi:hypothetical protein
MDIGAAECGEATQGAQAHALGGSAAVLQSLPSRIRQAIGRHPHPRHAFRPLEIGHTRRKSNYLPGLKSQMFDPPV